MLVVQPIAEGVTSGTGYPAVVKYSGPIRLV